MGHSTIRLGLVEHSNHHFIAPGENPISQALAVTVHSPGDFSTKPARMIAAVKRRNITFTAAAATAYARKFRRLSVRSAKAGLSDRSPAGTYGQIAEKTTQYQRDRCTDFSQHSFYLLGDTFFVCGESGDSVPCSLLRIWY